MTVDISWLGVAVATLALFVLGGIWYVALFGKAYRRELGVPDAADGESGRPPAPALGRALIGQLIAGFMMALLLALLIGNDSVGHGLLVGVIAGALVAASLVQLYQFEGKSIRHLLINVGYLLVGFTAVGAIIGAFQAA